LRFSAMTPVGAFPLTKAASSWLTVATARVHRPAVVTRNVRDFEPMGVPLLTPWSTG